MKDNPITRYWIAHYMSNHCSLCGNAGIIDSRGVKTAAGVEVGRLNYCICPNGQSLRRQGAPMEEWLRLGREKVG